VDATQIKRNDESQIQHLLANKKKIDGLVRTQPAGG